ncbi:MAG: hypothetical protein ABL892_06210 [Thiobacillaceae bacterium]
MNHFITQTAPLRAARPGWPLRWRAGMVAATTLLVFSSAPAQAVPAPSVDLYEMAMFLNADNLNSGISLGDYAYTAYAPGGLSDFVSGYPGQFDMSYTSTLDAGNYGSMVWDITNNTGATLMNVRVFGYLNADIGLDYASNSGERAATGMPDWYQVGLFDMSDPVLDNLLFGSLSNDSAMQGPGDVVLGLGFAVGDIVAGGHIRASFSIDGSSGMLRQFDDSGEFYFSGAVAVVPEPQTWMQLLAGLLVLGALSTRRRIERRTLQ